MLIKDPLRIDYNCEVGEFIKRLRGRLKGNIAIKNISGICLDSRSIRPNDVFFALEALRDGHDFVQSAFEAGACACVVHKQVSQNNALIEVSNTQEALNLLAKTHRDHYNGQLVAISGSNGKTSTKEILYSILSTKYKTHKTPGTWNNHLGVALSVLLLKKEHECAVFEMGMNHAGELKQLCEVAKPNIGLLTNIGRAHIEALGNIENIANAKGELFESVMPNGEIVVFEDDENIKAQAQRFIGRHVCVSMKNPKADVYYKTIEPTVQGYKVQVQYGDQPVTLNVAITGEHQLKNLLCALGVSWILGVPGELLQKGVDQIMWPDMRLKKESLKHEIDLIVDCYNANPESTLAALSHVGGLTAKRKILVMGDMLELGDMSSLLHKEIGSNAYGKGFDFIFTLGRYGKDVRQGAIENHMSPKNIFCFEDVETLNKNILALMSAGDLVLFKASRAMKLERVVHFLKTHYVGKAV